MAEVPGAGPPVGQVSPDGMFRWNGTEWAPIGARDREPTAWTRPMQLITAAYLVVITVVSVAFTFAYVSRAALIRAMQNQPASGGVPPDQLGQTLGVVLAFIFGFVVFIGLVYLFLALGTFRGWTWVFYADLVVLGLATVSEILSVLRLAAPSAQLLPLWALIVNVVVGAAAPILFVWLLIGLIRYGPWARARPGRV